MIIYRWMNSHVALMFSTLPPPPPTKKKQNKKIEVMQIKERNFTEVCSSFFVLPLLPGSFEEGKAPNNALCLRISRMIG